MPSASAKIEKVASAEATDAVKQIVNMFEKRVRNLEKRKMKLDNYRSDVANGKELNEDQKMAVSKYDQVEGNLEFAKEFSKSMNVIVVECARQQKKQAKKEQLERQQHEIQRLQEAFIFRHILSCFQNEDVRSDFLNGENGAIMPVPVQAKSVKFLVSPEIAEKESTEIVSEPKTILRDEQNEQLTSEQLSQLDQFYKLIGFGLPNEQEDLVNHFHVLAENLIFLVEGKNKEIAGTTYKVLKELLRGIKESGYFSRPSEPPEEDGISSDELPEEESVNEKVEQNEDFPVPEEAEKILPTDEEQFEAVDDVSSTDPVLDELPPEMVPNGQNGPLGVLEVESSFNFLQESQIDLDAPHMDPAVVAVHQIAPPPTAPFIDPYTDTTKVNGTEPKIPTSPPLTTNPVSMAAVDFDPSHPIPTQTFTNQSFVVMQNMVPQGYVPVTMHHRVLPQHIAVVASETSPVVPMPVAAVPMALADIEKDLDAVQVNGDENSNEMERNTNYLPGERGSEGNGYNQYRGGYRGRGRGRGNNQYFRGRNNYHNNRGGYQNNYYQDRNGYRGNFRRGNNQDGPRNRGNNRGRGSFKPQGPPQQPQNQQTEQ